MRSLRALVAMKGIAIAGFALAPAAVSGEACEAMTALALTGARVTLAETVAAGAFSPPPSPDQFGPPPDYSKLPEFCRIEAQASPAPGSAIRFEVWLPSSGWNGKLVGVGNGGYSGAVWHWSMLEPLSRGYASVSTDTGHSGTALDASFGLGRPERVVDFGHRAIHEMTVHAKAIVSAYYGEPAKSAYFTGCSTGGRQGLMSAQRYPSDYDGIVAGAPASYLTRLSAHGVWNARALHETDRSFIPREKLPVLHGAAVAACDSHDGVADGVIENPARCDFDPAAIACAASDEPSCLVAEQVVAARKLYGPMVHPDTGTALFPGLPRGSELNWAFFQINPEPVALTTGLYQLLLFQDPAWSWRSLDLGADVARAERELGPVVDAIDPKLAPFFERGGKLLQWHGWGDGGITAHSSIDYYERVKAASTRPEQLAASYRLFMAPGVHHCRGGEGPDQFDALGTLEAWVERGQAPERIVASLVRDGETVRTRPWCPYPQVASYRGAGSTDDAANFECKAP